MSSVEDITKHKGIGKVTANSILKALNSEEEVRY